MATTVGSSTSAFAVSGLASGIDTQSIINALMQVDSQPVNLVKTQQTAVKTHLAAVQQMNTNLLAVSDALDPLMQNSTFAAKTTTSSNTAALTVSASTSAVPGTLNVNIKRLASASQYVSTDTETDPAAALGTTGSITLQTVTGDPVVVTPSDYSLNGIASAINGAKAGITAAVINDGTGYRLLVTSSQTGQDNAILEVSGTGDLAGVLGGSSTSGFELVSDGLDAQIRLGDPDLGLLLTSPTNTVTQALPGLTLNLTDVADNIKVTTAADGSTVAGQITAFANALNTAQSYFDTNSVYNADTKTAGQLFSDSILRSQLLSLRAAVRSVDNTQPAGYRSLADIGVTFDASGKLTVDAAKLQDKLGQDSDAVSALFKSVGGSVNTQLDRLTATKIGSLQLEQDQLNSQISTMSDRIKSLNDQVTARQTYYQNQFNTMEKLIAQLNSQSQALSSFISYGLTSSSSKK